MVVNMINLDELNVGLEQLIWFMSYFGSCKSGEKNSDQHVMLVLCSANALELWTHPVWGRSSSA